MNDAVLSYHMNPYGCGVAKFNLRLAKELGVPCLPLLGRDDLHHPLVSMKHSEYRLYSLRPRWEAFDLFLHDAPAGPLVDRWWRENHPVRVYAANPVIARELRAVRPDVITAWCPSTIETPPPRAPLTILTFGMAHKLVLPYFEQLRDLLERHGEQYTILLSTGVHEGTPWDEALEGAARNLRAVFDRPGCGGVSRVEVLGYLSDAALDREIRAATACAAFYTPALRANNTTAYAVLERAAPLITNVDSDSPALPVFNITAMHGWPSGAARVLSTCGPFSTRLIESCSWDNLAQRMRAEVPCAK